MDNDTKIFQLYLSLMDSEPVIWRRILVPDDYSLGDLHYIIQVVLGWDNCHLHGFRYNSRSFGPIGPDSFEQDEDEDAIKLRELLNKTGDALIYEYDFGDSWEHRIRLENVVECESGQFFPSCSDGENAGPPEDVGGIWRYNWIVQTLSETDNEYQEDELDEEVQEFVENNFDPEHFDLDDINERLQYWAGLRDGTVWDSDTHSGDDSEDMDINESEDYDEVTYVYDASQAIDIYEWRNLDELDKIYIVEEYHKQEKPHALPNALKTHAITHIAVEEQVINDDPPETQKILADLIDQGLSRHEAIHAIGSVYADLVFSVVNLGQKPDHDAYVDKISQLTAKKWLLQKKRDKDTESRKNKHKNKKKKEKNKKHKS